MRALVTGGGGFLGEYVIDHLLARGDEVRNLARGNYSHLAAKGVECVSADLRDATAVREACRGVGHHRQRERLAGAVRPGQGPQPLHGRWSRHIPRRAPCVAPGRGQPRQHRRPRCLREQNLARPRYPRGRQEIGAASGASTQRGRGTAGDNHAK